jgi:hypothetical protein
MSELSADGKSLEMILGAFRDVDVLTVLDEWTGDDKHS